MIDCDLNAVTHDMPLLKLNKTTYNKEQEHSLILNEISMLYRLIMHSL